MEQVLDRAQLRVSAGQRPLQAVHPLDAAHPGQHPGRPPQPDRLRLSLQLVISRVREADPAAGQPLRRFVREHLPMFRRRLHPGGGVHRVPSDHALADRPKGHRYLPGDDSGPGGQAWYVYLGAQLAHGVHQVQRGPHGPLGVPLHRHWGTPHRHHGIADELLHHPPVPFDHGPGRPEILRQQLPDGLWIPGFRQRGEPDHVTEQH